MGDAVTGVAGGNDISDDGGERLGCGVGGDGGVIDEDDGCCGSSTSSAILDDDGDAHCSSNTDARGGVKVT